MGIKIQLAKMMGEKNILKISELARATGVHRLTLTKIIKGTTKGIEFETLDKLCEFFKWEPGDLIVKVPDKKDD